MLLYAPVPPDSVMACEFGISNRNYDCEHCEHFHVDCELGERIQWNLEHKNYNALPGPVQSRILEKLIEQNNKAIEELKQAIKE